MDGHGGKGGRLKKDGCERRTFTINEREACERQKKECASKCVKKPGGAATLAFAAVVVGEGISTNDQHKQTRPATEWVGGWRVRQVLVLSSNHNPHESTQKPQPAN
jgi:hypothetical protein